MRGPCSTPITPLTGSFFHADPHLNPEFTGTFGLRPGLRQLHRKAESLLIEADKWAALQGLVGTVGVTKNAWWKMAFAQSHDVYTGSHPTAVYNETIAQLEQVAEHSNAVLTEVASKLGNYPPLRQAAF